MKCRLLKLSFLLFPCSGFAEDSLQTQPRFELKLMPLALLENGAGPSARAGLEYRLGKSFNHYTDFSYYLPNSAYYSDVTGFRVRTALRYYFGGDSMFFSFTGLSFMYKNQDFDFTGPLRDSAANSKAYHIHKEVFAADIIFGRALRIYGQFFIELEGGIGIRFRRLYSDRYSDQAHDLLANGNGSVAISTDPNLDITVDAIASCKLVYRIR